MYSNKKIANIKRALVNSNVLEACAEQCGIIGDFTRLKVCYLLKHYPGLSVSELAYLVGTSISNVSHSLAKMKAAGLVESTKQAQTVYYSLKPRAFDNVLQIIGG